MSRWMNVLLFGLLACDQTTAPLPPTATPILQLDPQVAVAFGLIFQHEAQTITREVVVTNLGTGPLEGTLRVDGRDSDLFQLSASSIFLESEQTQAVSVTMATSRVTELDARLVIDNNDPDQRVAILPLEGEVRVTCMEVTPERFAFDFFEVRDVVVTAVAPDCMLTEVALDNGAFEWVNTVDLPVAISESAPLTLSLLHRRVRLPRPTATLTVNSGDGASFQVALEGAPPKRGCFSGQRRSVLLSDAQLGGEVLGTQTIQNDCDVPAVLGSSRLRGAATISMTHEPLPVILQPGQSVAFDFAYRPTERLDSEMATAEIATNDIENDTVFINVRGTQVQSEPDLFPSRLDLGDFVVGCPSGTRAVRVYNHGVAPLEVERIELDGADFEIETMVVEERVVSATPFEVPRQGAAFVRVRAAATATRGDRSTELRVHHNGANEPFRVRLEATSTETTTLTDRFVQSTSVDVLWVVDTTGSARSRADLIRDRMPDFLAALTTDYHVGVTSLSPNRSPGAFASCTGRPAFVARSEPDRSVREQDLICAFDAIRANGAGFERGVLHAKQALTNVIDPFDVDESIADFLRDDARLVVAFVSNADDQSLISHFAFLEFLASLKNDRLERTRIYAVAGPVDRRCSIGSAQPGFRYRLLTQQTHGAFYDICDPDYLTSVTDLATHALQLGDEWTLSKPATPGTIVVRVDGLVRASDDFVFDADDNVVRLNTPPPVGAVIDVTYRAACPQ